MQLQPTWQTVKKSQRAKAKAKGKLKATEHEKVSSRVLPRKRSRAPDENGRERAEPEADDQNVDMEGRVPVPDADDQNVGVDGRVFPSTRSPGLLYSVARNKVSGSRFVTGQGSGDLFNAQTAPRSLVRLSTTRILVARTNQFRFSEFV